jgi:hypothetical protein
VRSCCVLSFVMPNMRNGGSLTEASFNNAAAARRFTGLLSVVVALEARCLTHCRIVLGTSFPQFR